MGCLRLPLYLLGFDCFRGGDVDFPGGESLGVGVMEAITTALIIGFVGGIVAGAMFGYLEGRMTGFCTGWNFCKKIWDEEKTESRMMDGCA